MSFIAILLFVLTLAVSGWASYRVHSLYNKYAQVTTTSGATGAEVAHKILQAAGISDVEIVSQDGFLGDHYDPRNKRLVLSDKNYHGTSISALGVSAHECGHAIQHKIAYAPLEIRGMAVGAATFANQLVLWLPLLGAMTGLVRDYRTMAVFMSIGWGIIMLFNLVTLPVEFDASRRAKLILNKMGFIRSGEETIGVNKVLDAAGMTYVAAFFTSLVYFLWHLLPLLIGRRDD